MKKVIINGVSYVGDLKKNEDGTMTLSKAMSFEGTTMSRSDLSKYLKLKNLGELENLDFGGTGISWSISVLSENENMMLQIGEIAMKSAKGRAVKEVENDLFDFVLGK